MVLIAIVVSSLGLASQLSSNRSLDVIYYYGISATVKLSLLATLQNIHQQHTKKVNL